MTPKMITKRPQDKTFFLNFSNALRTLWPVIFRVLLHFIMFPEIYLCFYLIPSSFTTGQAVTKFKRYVIFVLCTLLRTLCSMKSWTDISTQMTECTLSKRIFMFILELQQNLFETEFWGVGSDWRLTAINSLSRSLFTLLSSESFIKV